MEPDDRKDSQEIICWNEEKSTLEHFKQNICQAYREIRRASLAKITEQNNATRELLRSLEGMS
jgi:hypothetical protein